MLKIQHSIKGRTRFKYSLIKNNPPLAAGIERNLSDQEGVLSVRCNISGSSIIIKYNPDALNNNALLKLIRHAEPYDVEIVNSACDSCFHKNVTDNHLQEKSLEFVGLSIVTAGVFIRSKIMKAVIGQSLFSPLGIIGALFSIPLIKRAVDDIKQNKKITLNTFLAGGIAAALLGGEAETALEILWVESGSDVLSAWVSERSRRAIRGILEVSEKTAFIVRDDIEQEIPVEKIRPGDIVTAHTGEKIAVDGIIVSGEGMINEAPINGRSELIHKTSGDGVYAGTFVSDGVIYIKAEHVGDSTYLARILFMVEESLANKADIELEADRLAHRLVNIGLVTTIGTFLITRSFYRAFSVLLVMSCPCATVLAASSAVSSALSNAASKGILIKGGRYLEEAGSQSSFCFDKTGTLTDDHPVLTDIYPLDGYDEDTVLHTAHVAEMHNRHPLAMAIRGLAEEHNLEHPHHTVCDSILGMGARAESDGSEYLVGNSKLMKKYSISVGSLSNIKKKYMQQGKTVMYVAKDRKIIGLICASNRLKPEVPALISALRTEGVKELILLTGDEKDSARALAEELGFDSFYASVLPKEKSNIVEEIQKKHKVAMVGDGINDVLALSSSDLGIAMGAMGSDVAIETADIALVDDDLAKIIYLRRLSTRTKEIINQNFTLATATNILGAGLGVFGLLSPIMAGGIHIAHTLGIVANSSRLLLYDTKIKEDTENECD